MQHGSPGRDNQRPGLRRRRAWCIKTTVNGRTCRKADRAAPGRIGGLLSPAGPPANVRRVGIFTDRPNERTAAAAVFISGHNLVHIWQNNNADPAGGPAGQLS